MTEPDVAPKGKVFSLRMEDVNENPEELVAMRGEGRYFGVTDTHETICANCHRKGHKRQQCKVVVCHSCGAVDDHYYTQCPQSVVCSICGTKGHFRNNCPDKGKMRNSYCRVCDSRAHSSDRCPTIWRCYITIKTKDKIGMPQIWCYNCGSKGHFGDECLQQRSSRTPNLNGSSFSGGNLPKSLRSQYYSTLDGRRSTSSYNYSAVPPPRYGSGKRDSEDPRGDSRPQKRNHRGHNRDDGPPIKKGRLPPPSQITREPRRYPYNSGNRNSNIKRGFLPPRR
ncbi:RNA-binding subunit [Komagataella phaffii CBS 7435]|uniref:RING finger protein that interacts with the arginine methyltransferase Hmt1p n=2 Tax=Komagataella phaffii TaxID=460519 RepID=C4R2F3_KOMPG|nr:RING finger protein that interacts with the arginine methyltransferase Hmt1p [Komagataella phaffii GS115]CAH2447770.1 RNA-binding subunit [Komagataella phaffii CBS 7435]CAY69677.1 RING finger protein that interacts with the arginine methyltransferase Hmt1p [Komagataella phaffii GS115]CCA37947.1 RNA-binding subunit [Komagataella phaffii CBS 7435]